MTCFPRGKVALFLRPTSELAYERVSPRHGDWAFKRDAQVVNGGLGGSRRLGYDVKFVPTYFVSDAFSV